MPGPGLPPPAATVTVTPAEPLGWKVASPPKEAVIEWPPAASAVVVTDAVPLASVPTPSDVVPSRKVTVPVGTPASGTLEATTAVKVTACPAVEGLADEV